MKSDAEIVRLALLMCANTEVAKASYDAWNAVCDELEHHFKEKKPKMKVFEMHHTIETARRAFLSAMVDKQDMLACISAALRAVRL